MTFRWRPRVRVESRVLREWPVLLVKQACPEQMVLMVRTGRRDCLVRQGPTARMGRGVPRVRMDCPAHQGRQVTLGQRARRGRTGRTVWMARTVRRVRPGRWDLLEIRGNPGPMGSRARPESRGLLASRGFRVSRARRATR